MDGADAYSSGAAWPKTTDIDDVVDNSVDKHAAFRWTFETTRADTTVSIRHSGASFYNVFVDGEYVAEGLTRFVQGQPYYAVTSVLVAAAGTHVLAVHAHSCGVQTRTLLLTPPFVACDITISGTDDDDAGAPRCLRPAADAAAAAVAVAVAAAALPAPSPAATVSAAWRCILLTSYASQWRRMSNLLGWMECCTVEAGHIAWRLPGFDDSEWALAVPVVGIKAPVPLAGVVGPASSVEGPMREIARGTLVERFGYADDDPPARFALRLLSTTSSTTATRASPPLPAAAPPPMDYGPMQGRWWRFDVGRCQLMRPVLQVSAPAGAVVEVCYCQNLIDGKASPYHPLTGGPSSYVDRYTLGSTVDQTVVTITPLEPRGCRFIEVHVVFDDADNVATKAVVLVSARALFRCYSAYHAEPVGTFQCPTDSLLATIWATGTNTTRSCIEDVPVDGPCRERGQWLGDSAAVTLPNLVYTYDDISPIRIMLLQTMAMADSNGVFSGNSPEGGAIADYALLWFEAAIGYVRASGDLEVLDKLFVPACRCMDYFLSSACYTEGVGFNPPGLGLVIDWGYTDNKAFPVNMCLQALLVSALRAQVALSQCANKAAAEAKYTAALTAHVALVKTYVGVSDDEVVVDGDDYVVVGPAFVAPPTTLGFHALALLLRAGILQSDPAALEYAAATLKNFITACFPVNASAPRLSDPGKRSATGFYTPYFHTFSFEGLFKAGEADFVLSQYKTAWGWALKQSSTWLEVFDLRSAGLDI